MFILGFSLAFVALHSFLYLFDRKEPGNLHLAVSALGFAVFSWIDATRLEGPVPTSRAAAVLALAGLWVMILGFIRFGHHFTGQHAPRIFGFFVAAATASVLWYLAFGSMSLQQLVVLLSLVELVRLLARGVRTPMPPRSWVVGIGFVTILITGGLETLTGLGVLPTELTIYRWGMLALFLSISVHLSWRFADTRHNLERQLQEVESLSRQKLEQERLAQKSALERTLLERDNERQKAELEAARELQLSMLPGAAPRLPGIEVAFEMRTATEVGGDYYDFHLAHQSDASGSEEAATLTLVVGDATGHGLDAGLVVAATKGLFHAAAANPDLEELLRSMTKGLEGLQLKRRFMALTLMRLRGAELELFTAGMPPVLLMRSGSDQAEELSLEDPPLASIRDHRYRSLTVELLPGDTVLAVSDGFPERRDPSDRPLGYSAFPELLANRAHQPLGEVLGACFDLADRWANGAARHDDETALLLRRL